MRLLLAVVMMLGVAVAARAQDSVRLVAALAKGDVLRYDLNARLELKAKKGGEVLEQKLRLRLTAAEIGKDSTTVRGVLEHAVVTYQEIGAEAPVTVEWREGEAAPEEGIPLAKLYRAVGGSVIELTLDANGRIREVSGLERVAAAGKGLSNPTRALGVLAPEAIERTLGPIFTLDESGAPRKVGEGWKSTSVVSAGVWRTNVVCEQQLKSLDNGKAVVEGTNRFEVRTPKEGVEDLTPRVEIARQASSIESEWDTARSRLLMRMIAVDVEWKATLPLKEPIAESSNSVSRIELKLVKP